jgi:hypothetical protein
MEKMDAKSFQVVADWITKDCATIVQGYLTPLPPLPYLDELKVNTRAIRGFLGSGDIPGTYYTGSHEKYWCVSNRCTNHNVHRDDWTLCNCDPKLPPRRKRRI